MHEPKGSKFLMATAIVVCVSLMAFAAEFELAVISPDNPLVAIGTVLISGLVATALTLALWTE